MVRDLKGRVEREKVAIGLFITLVPPTKPMQTETVSGGYYKSPYTALSRASRFSLLKNY